MLIDTDIHVSPAGALALVDYLDAATRDLVLNSGSNGLMLPNYPWAHPKGWARTDVLDFRSDDPADKKHSLEKVQRIVLDEYDTTIGILTPDGTAGGIAILPNPVLAAKLASAHNDWMYDEYLRHEPRLRGLITIAPQHPEEAEKEIRRSAALHDEFVGIFLPGAARIPFGNPVYDPIWRASADLGLPVVVHTHFEGVGIAGPVTAAGYPDFYLEYHTLCGSGLFGHLISVLCHGIFERFPGSKLMLMEGGLVPFVGFIWRLDTNWKGCRTEVPWVKKLPSEYVWENVKFSTQPLETPEDESLLAPALEGLRPWDTLCFASDYPHWDFDEPTQTLRTLPAEWRDNIAWKNAADFFRLQVPVAA